MISLTDKTLSWCNSDNIKTVSSHLFRTVLYLLLHVFNQSYRSDMSVIGVISRTINYATNATLHA